MLCDLDRFKQVNDTYGHERGDAVLKEAAYAIRKTLRSFELVYRIGGEELLVVLPDVELAEGVAIGERLRIAVEDARPGGLDLTLSAGVAAAAGHAVSYDDLFREADGALMCAKRAGPQPRRGRRAARARPGRRCLRLARAVASADQLVVCES